MKRSYCSILITIICLLSPLVGCGPKEIPPANATPLERECTSDHPMVGKTATFSTLQHGVTGRATIVSDCEVLIEDFFYDGLGIDVRVYGALNGNFPSGSSLSDDLSGSAHAANSFSVFIPDGQTFDGINSLSIWCVSFAVDFGSLQF